MSTVKQILRLLQKGQSKKGIARIVGVSRNTVKSYERIIVEQSLSYDELLSLEDHELLESFSFGRKELGNERLAYFSEHVDDWLKELQGTGVTRFLLWQEYRIKQSSGYSYTQFCHHLQQHQKVVNSSMVQHHRPADKLYIDFSGKKAAYYDPVSGEEQSVELLIACLGYSQKAFVIGMESQKTEDFIVGMNTIFKHLGGVTHAIVPDNMKTAVTKSDRYEPSINQVFEDFANHYQTAIVPTRALHPKDKALVENMVRMVYRSVLAPIRNQVFTSLQELNSAIQTQVVELNTKPFQRKDYSRQDLFDTQEKALLKPLPTDVFQIKKYKAYTVQKNSHITLTEDDHYYSVPYAYIGQKVEVIYTHSQVNIYHKNKQVASHVRIRKRHAYSSIDAHLPSKYRDYRDRSPEYYRQQATRYSSHVQQVINYVLIQKMYPEQTYKSCDGLLQLAKRTPADLFDNACQIALQAQVFNYKFIQNLIVNGTAKNYQAATVPPPSPKHDNIRGKSFFSKLINNIL